MPARCSADRRGAGRADDQAVLLVSEVFGNSVRHSGSGAPGETVTVAVIAGDPTVIVEVTDRTGPGTPELRSAGRDAEGGRGLVAGQSSPRPFRMASTACLRWEILFFSSLVICA